MIKDYTLTLKFSYKNVPNILIGALEAAETNGDSEQALAAPQVAGCDGGLSHCQRLVAI